jgi:hypothetical protein
LSSTQAQISAATGMATTGQSVVLQSIAGTSATSYAALHRCTATVNSMVIYDTSKDNDGGAWTQKCDKSSWFNEPIYGNWLGPNVSEFFARAKDGATFGPELLTNGTFDTGITGWVAGTPGNTTWTNGSLKVTALVGGSASDSATQSISVTANTLYCLSVGKIQAYDANGNVDSSGGNYRARVALGVSPGSLNMIASSGLLIARLPAPIALSDPGYIYFVPTVSTTLTVICETASNAVYAPQGYSAVFDNVSVKQVTSLVPNSGSYFQNTADGKFYRLWKNLFGNSSALNSSPWVTTHASVTANTTTDHNGVLLADKLVEDSTNGGHFIQHSGAGMAATFGVMTVSCYAKAAERTRFRITNLAGYYAADVDLNAGTVNATTGTATITNLGGGIYRISATSAIPIATAHTPVFQLADATGNTSYQGDGVSGLYIWGVQFEYGAMMTALEDKTTSDQGTTEIFRGNRAKFPRLSAWIAEAGRVIGYDLTQTGCPMWMVFSTTSGGSGNNLLTAANASPGVNHVNAGHGYLTIGGTNCGGMLLNFPRDDIRYTGAGNFVLQRRRIGDRQLANSIQNTTGNGDGFTCAFGNGSVNWIGITVTPDAPLDPVTGLQVPTFAIMNTNGANIIKNDGLTVLSSSAGGNWNAPMAFNPYLLAYGASGDNLVRILPQPNSASANWAPTITNQAEFSGGSGSFGGQTKALALGKRGLLARISTTLPRLFLNRVNEGAGASSLAAGISDTYNTGWMSGDMRRVYLSDTASRTWGEAVATEICTDTGFDVPALWQTGAGWTVSGGIATGTNTSNYLYQNLAGITAYSIFKLTITVSNYTAGSLYMFVGQNAFARSPAITANGTYTYYVQCDGSIGQTGVLGSGFSGSIDNFSCKNVGILDRTTKSKAVHVFGTLTSAAVNTGNQLVGYSGWSASSYAQELAYSSDLDFGTGSWQASAWVNFIGGSTGGNLLKASNLLTDTSWTKLSGTTVTVSGGAFNVVPSTTSGSQGIAQTGVTGYCAPIFSCEVHANGYTKVAIGEAAQTGNWAAFDLTAGTVVFNQVAGRITNLGGGWYRISMKPFADGILLGGSGSWYVRPLDAAWTNQNPNTYTFAGNGTSGVLVRNCMVSSKQGAGSVTDPDPYVDNPSTTTSLRTISPIVERSYSSGAYLQLGIDFEGKLIGTVYDGTTTRTVTSTISFSGTGWVQTRLEYTSNGSLTLKLNGTQIAQTNGTSLLTLNNSSALLTIGNTYSTTSWFPTSGSIALVKIGATVPTPEQSLFMWTQENEMFSQGSQVALPDSNNLLDLDYDDLQDKFKTVSSTYEMSWIGLVRASTESVLTASTGGTFFKCRHSAGVRMVARAGSFNPGVDITLPALIAREELFKRAEPAGKVIRQTRVFDWTGQFIGFLTNAFNRVDGVSGMDVPQQTTYVGAQITGTGIPAGTTLSSLINGSGQVFMSANATANINSSPINFLDFILPPGWEALEVLAAGTSKREGSTKDWIRLWDGFKETIRFNTAPGNVWVQVIARRIAI